MLCVCAFINDEYAKIPKLIFFIRRTYAFQLKILTECAYRLQFLNSIYSLYYDRLLK